MVKLSLVYARPELTQPLGCLAPTCLAPTCLAPTSLAHVRASHACRRGAALLLARNQRARRPLIAVVIGIGDAICKA
jgi:hypothetical protein